MRRLVLRRGGDGRYLVIFATSAGSFPEGAILGARLTERFSFVSGVARLVGDSRSRNERATTLAGSGLLADETAGLRLTTGAGSFLQVNSAQAAALYRKVEEFAAASPGERVLDLYCGAGAITLLLARRAGGATGVESSEEAVRSAERNARDNGLAGCRFVRGDARRVLASMVYDGQKQDLVVVNPPRAGSRRKWRARSRA